MRLDYKHAVALFEKAVAISEKAHDIWFLARQEESLGQIYGVHDRQKAIYWYRRAVKSLEAIKAKIVGEPVYHEVFFDELSYVYQRFIEFLSLEYFNKQKSSSILEEIGNIMELSKAHVLLKRIEGNPNMDLSGADFVSDLDKVGERKRFVKEEIHPFSSNSSSA